MTLASHIHLDPLGGIAGDMFVAALLDAFPELEAPLLELLNSLHMPVPVVVGLTEHSDHALRGKRFSVRPRPSAPQERHKVAADNDLHMHAHRHPHVHAQSHPHHEYMRDGHVSHKNIIEWLSKCALTKNVRLNAIGIFRMLAEAEASVHGVPLDKVEFHEVGAWDSIADVVAAAFLIDAIDATSWSVGPLPIGGGLIATAHGVLPAPAPATAWLTKGMTMFDDGVLGERVTPTGAAVLRYLRAGTHRARTHASAMTLSSTGMGFGTRQLSDRANALRCLAFTTEAIDRVASSDEAVNCIAFEVDDQSSEDLAVGLDRLRAHPGVLQVIQVPAFGKKGRMAVKVEMVTTIAATGDVIDHCFLETTTIGLRVTPAERRVLPRTIVHPEGSELVAVKLVQRGSVVTAKAEMDELAAGTSGHVAREQLRRASEAEALLSSKVTHESD